MATIAFVMKGKSTLHKTKLVVVRYSFIKEKIDEGEIKAQFTSTPQDMFTKPLHGEHFRVMPTKVLECYTVYCIEYVKS